MASPRPANPLSLLPSLEGDLARVEHELAAVAAESSFLTEVAGHLIRAGGKRVRPGFALVCAQVTDGAVTNDIVRGAAAVELVHIGSLYHDDVMDEAETRRTVESVNKRWGNLTAILAGDFLLARASEIAASLGVEVAGLLASTIAELCEGQVREIADAYAVERTAEDYYASIDGKTAALVATACRVGAIVGDLPRPFVDTVTQFGRNYGMAFQVIDDILDLTATDDQLGKPAGNDLLEGTYTLPVIRALTGDHGDELRSILGGPLDVAARDQARTLVRESGTIAASLDEAVTFCDQARAALEPLPDTPARVALHAATEDLLDRAAAAR